MDSEVMVVIYDDADEVERLTAADYDIDKVVHADPRAGRMMNWKQMWVLCPKGELTS